MPAQTLEASREQLTQMFAEAPDLIGSLMTPSKWEKVIYYRKPERYPDARHPKGRLCNQPGWIFWGDSQDSRQLEYMREGNVPLLKFGVLSEANAAWKHYGNWGPILTHPEGPASFPVDQLLCFRWFDPDECPVPGVIFPQLRGRKITRYVCPDCHTYYALEANLLGRHLVVTHNYNREMLELLSQRWGLSFDKDYAKGGRLVEEYDYTEPEADAEGEGGNDDSRAARRYQVDTDVVRVEPISADVVREAFGTPQAAEPETPVEVAARHAAAQDGPGVPDLAAMMAQIMARLEEIEAQQLRPTPVLAVGNAHDVAAKRPRGRPVKPAAVKGETPPVGATT